MAAFLVPERRPTRIVFRQSRDHLSCAPPNLLLTTLKVAAVVAVVAMPFSQEDWPNPQRSPVRDLTWLQSPQVQQIVPAAVAVTAPRSTTFTDYNAPKKPVEFQPPNTLLTLLAVPAAPVVVVPTPFNQEDWPNPRGSSVRDLTWTQTPEVIPQVPDIAVANRIPNQTDWPNPARPWIRDLTWTQSPAVPPTSIPPVPAPFAQEDWPNPQRSPIRDLTWTQTPEVIPPVVIPPVVVQAPFEQADWPNPLRSPVLDLTWTQSPQVQQIVPGAAVAEGQRAHGFTDYFAKPLPVQFDPPNMLALLAPPVAEPVVVVPVPFNQENWPNPVARVRIKTPESFRLPFDTVVTPPVPAPFAQEDWPNPVRRISPKEWGFTRFANIGDVPPRVLLPAPFDKTDWPNPLTPWRRDLTWLQSPQVQEIPAPPPSPFVQADWPNPAKPWQRDLNWNQSPQVQQIVPEPAGTVKPFLQAEWPNPVLRTPFKESGWVRFANIGDIPAAAPPVPVPPVVDEVKPSGGRVDHEFKYAIEGRKTYVQKLRDWRIAQEAAEVIEQVALQQAATLEIDEAKNARELKRALRLAKVQDDTRYLELLAERRELAKNEEIGALLYKAMQDEEDILALLMIAAQLL